MMRWTAILVIALSALLLATACNEEEGDGIVTNGWDPALFTPLPPPDPTDTPPPPEPTAEAVSYEIVSREDLNVATAIRVEFRVSVSGPLTEPELRRIAAEIIDDETSRQDVNAIGFFFFLPGTDTSGAFTAGKADWAPNGDWASAVDVEAGDYSSHELGDIVVGNALNP